VDDRIERELVVDASPEEVWDAIVGDGWLAEEVELDLRVGGDAIFRSGRQTKTGWVEDVLAPERLAFWWAVDGQPATRVELRVLTEQDATRVRVVESRPLDVLDLVGTPLPGASGWTFGPALVAA
jgi:uncharacterized protein YndB with AHSA1/START domain